jgi:hypothetical protein
VKLVLSQLRDEKGADKNILEEVTRGCRYQHYEYASHDLIRMTKIKEDEIIGVCSTNEGRERLPNFGWKT